MKVLVADDDPTSVLLLTHALTEWGYEPVGVPDGDSAWEVLRGADAPPLAILDWMMPGLDGLEVCRRVRRDSQMPYTYIILLTGRAGTSDLVSGMEAGADDYVSKPCEHMELCARLRAGRRIVELQEALQFQVSHDHLTGLLSRGAVLDVLCRELARSARERRPAGLLIADVDHFKRLNDTFGHLAGDAALREVARRMAGVLRPYDAIGRYGGEEFLAVLPGCDAAASREAAERIRHVVSETPVVLPNGETSLTASIGVATVDGDGPADTDALIHEADAALYRAKNAGRDRVEIAPDRCRSLSL